MLSFVFTFFEVVCYLSRIKAHIPDGWLIASRINNGDCFIQLCVCTKSLGTFIVSTAPSMTHFAEIEYEEETASS